MHTAGPPQFASVGMTLLLGTGNSRAAVCFLLRGLYRQEFKPHQAVAFLDFEMLAEPLNAVLQDL
jgi:hypothetical protein